MATLPAQTEILIIGGGPAGSTLAYCLARLGVEVLLLEKAKFPRRKTCGGGVNLRTLRLLPFDFGPVVEAWITGVSFTRRLETPFVRRYSMPLLATVRRELFDEFLVEQAVRAGARFVDGTPFLSLRQLDRTVEVETPAGICRARFVAAADGAQSAAARLLGLMQGNDRMLTIHSEVPASLFSWVEPDTAYIDWGSLKRSYAYLFPKKTFVSLGAGGFGAPPALLKEYQRAFLAAHWHKDNETRPFSTAGFLLPLRRKREAVQKGRCLLLGDAAGLVNPFTGEGIYSAVRSARIASHVLVDALQQDWNSLEPYQEELDRDLMPELEAARLLREIFNLRPSYFHRRICAHDHWWRALAKILQGERSFLDVKKKLGPLGTLLLRMSR